MPSLTNRPGAEAEGERQARRRQAQRLAAIRRPPRVRSVPSGRRRLARRSCAPRPRSRLCSSATTSSRFLACRGRRRRNRYASAAAWRCRPDARRRTARSPAAGLGAPRGVAARAAARRPRAASSRRRRPGSRAAKRTAPRRASNGQLILRQDERVHLVLDVIEAVAVRRHGDAEQVAAARRRLRLVRHRSTARRAACPLAGSISTTWPFCPLIDQKMAVRRHRHAPAAAAAGRPWSRRGRCRRCGARGRSVPDRDDAVADRVGHVERAVRAEREAGRADQEHVLVGLRAEAARR